MRVLARWLQQLTTKMAATLYTNQVKNRGRVYEEGRLEHGLWLELRTFTLVDE